VLLASSASAAAADAAQEPPAGPSQVAIPYLDTAAIEPPQPWRIADCDAVRAASPLVRECDAETIVLAADAYDPDAGTAVLPVTMTSGARTLTVHYRVVLEAPAAPSIGRAVADRAVAAGALLRVPLSEFGIACVVCAQGGSTRVAAVDPAEAGSAWTTPTHVVFRASRDYRGSADVHIEIADDYGTAAPTGFTVRVYPAVFELTALDVAVPVDGDGRAEVDLTRLVAAKDAEKRVAIVGCGAPVHGSVTCDADGRAWYSGTGVMDQFGFHVAVGGEQAFGSVALVPADHAGGPVAAARNGDDPVPMAVLPPVPPDGSGHAPGGVFTPIAAMLDRVGAR